MIKKRTPEIVCPACKEQIFFEYDHSWVDKEAIVGRWVTCPKCEAEFVLTYSWEIVEASPMLTSCKVKDV